MSSTHSFCFIILIVCHYGSLDSSETDTEEEDPESLKALNVQQLNQPATFHWWHGIVPYYVDSDSYDDIIATRIRMAMSTIQSVSCVIFKQLLKKPPDDYVGSTWLLLTNPDNVRECVHETLIGDGGKAIMTLGYDCMQRRDIIHALFHVLGFRDEVTHPQRDMYVRVLWQNIQPKYRPLFRIRTEETPHKMMVEYDTMSVMHFHDRAYSVNGGATITPLISGLIINPSDKLSQLDIMKLRLAFGHECNKRKVGNLFETCQNALAAADDEYAEGSSGIDHNDKTQERPVKTLPLNESPEERPGKIKAFNNKNRGDDHKDNDDQSAENLLLHYKNRITDRNKNFKTLSAMTIPFQYKDLISSRNDRSKIPTAMTIPFQYKDLITSRNYRSTIPTVMTIPFQYKDLITSRNYRSTIPTVMTIPFQYKDLITSRNYRSKIPTVMTIPFQYKDLITSRNYRSTMPPVMTIPFTHKINITDHK